MTGHHPRINYAKCKIKKRKIFVYKINVINLHTSTIKDMDVVERRFPSQWSPSSPGDHFFWCINFPISKIFVRSPLLKIEEYIATNLVLSQKYCIFATKLLLKSNAIY